MLQQCQITWACDETQTAIRYRHLVIVQVVRVLQIDHLDTITVCQTAELCSIKVAEPVIQVDFDGIKGYKVPVIVNSKVTWTFCLVNAMADDKVVFKKALWFTLRQVYSSKITCLEMCKMSIT